MKKLMFALVAAATLVSNGAFAQSKSSKPRTTTSKGSGAQSAMYASNDSFAWGIGLGALVVVGVIVGVTVAAATSNVNSSN
jgi:hypothetical protein